MVKIKCAQTNDFPAILSLLQEQLDYHNSFAKDDFPKDIKSFREEPELVLKKFFNDSNAKILVAAEKSQIIAFLISQIISAPLNLPREIKKIGLVLEFFVQEKFRRCGVGHKLIENANNWFLSNGVTRIEVEVDSRNEEGKAAYQKLGFLTFRNRLKRIIQ